MIKTKLKQSIKKVLHCFKKQDKREINVLYKLLYDKVHDLDQSLEIIPKSTLDSFSHQWSEFPTGEYLLSDSWFRKNVDTILSTQEILLKKEWFQGKKVLDAGCGNGRWAFGFSKLGADVTCVDANLSALNATEEVLDGFSNDKRFIHTPLEDLDQHVAPGSFDLAFSWGVIHHCGSFTKALRNVANAVKKDGVIYLYLYGRESLEIEEDVELFKKRVLYNSLLNSKQRYDFLLKAAGGDKNKVHNVHDIYAPLINRRLEFTQVKSMLESLGFSQIMRTINHSELFVRAVKGDCDYKTVSLEPKHGPYWFQGRHL